MLDRHFERFNQALGGGASRARALQQAQVGLLRDTPFGHPFYWAPYMLINSWL